MTLEQFINWRKLKPLLLAYGIPAAILFLWMGTESIINGIEWLQIYAANWWQGCPASELGGAWVQAYKQGCN